MIHVPLQILNKVFMSSLLLMELVSHSSLPEGREVACADADKSSR